MIATINTQIDSEEEEEGGGRVGGREGDGEGEEVGVVEGEEGSRGRVQELLYARRRYYNIPVQIYVLQTCIYQTSFS